jgi:diguanylate cyclase (GGDEF)-like protein/PAS domain S-box-containing protein
MIECQGVLPEPTYSSPLRLTPPRGVVSRESKCGMANDLVLGDDIRNRELIEKLSAQAEALRCVNDSLAALIDLNLQLASERDPRALLEKVCRGAQELIGAKYGFLTVGDQAGREELLFVTSGIDIATLAAAKPLCIDAGTLARVLAENGPCRFSNPGGSPAALGLPAGFPAAHFLVAVPVVSLTSEYGWLCLVDKPGTEEFSAEDQHLLSILAAQVGRIYEYGSLYTEVKRDAEQLLLEMAERERATATLQESERRFSDMLRDVRMISVMLDRDGLITYCNDYLLQLTGWQRAEVLGGDWFDLFTPPECHDLRAIFTALLDEQRPPVHHENEILTRSGARRAIRWNNTVLRSVSGEIIGTASLGEDTTEQKEQLDRIARLSRIYAVMGGINSAIVRTHDRQQLLQEVCRIAVVEGAFPMVWIAAFAADTLEGSVVASCGASPEFLEKLRLTAQTDAPCEDLPGSRAVREMRPVICNDLEATTLEPLRTELLAVGIRSSAAFPLIVGSRAVAVLALLATETDFFDEQELRLLNSLVADISFGLQSIAKDEKLTHLAYYDALTGLANRTFFHERLSQFVSEGNRSERKFALVMADAERVEAINEAFGRHAGDQLVCQIAARLVRCAGDPSEVACVGPHLFAVVIPDVKSEGEVARTVEEWWRRWLNEPFQIDGNELRISARAGIVLFPSDGRDADSLLKNAEVALKKAKVAGERHLFYTPHLNERIAERLALENQLRRALENEEFVLHYQPKVDLEKRRLRGVEALIRWQNPELGLVPPVEFIPLMEETGMIAEVGAWALRQACLERSRWLQMGLNTPRVAVNVSTVQLRRKDFVGTVGQILELAGSEPGLDIEVTETLIMDDVESNIRKLEAIRDLGIGIAIDDFGTGYSSLGYLAKLPLEMLKIDRSFIAAMLDDPSIMTLVSTVITLAHSLKLTVIAEGVELEEQAKILRLLRCDQMQGYLISKPLAFDAMTTYLRESVS